MKQPFTLIGLLAVMLSTAAPTPESHPGSAQKDLNREIKKVIRYPDFAKLLQLQGVVAVKYVVDPCGTITVLEHSASDIRLADYVIHQLSKVHLDQVADGQDEERVLKITFRQQN